MHRATYELLEDETFYGEIPGFPGVYAHGETLESCRELLQEVLEGWIILGLRSQHNLPRTDQSIVLAVNCVKMRTEAIKIVPKNEIGNGFAHGCNCNS